MVEAMPFRRRLFLGGFVSGLRGYGLFLLSLVFGFLLAALVDLLVARRRRRGGDLIRASRGCERRRTLLGGRLVVRLVAGLSPIYRAAMQRFRSALLYHVSQLVRQQRFSRRGFGAVVACRKIDVAAAGEGFRMDIAIELVGFVPVGHA